MANIPCACGCKEVANDASMIAYPCRDGLTRYVRKEHLDNFHEQQVSQYRGPTGRQIVERAGLKCVERNRYYWKTRTVMLQSRVANGSDPASVIVATHEVAHSHQKPWLFRLLWLWPVRAWVEMDCWRRVFGDSI